MDKNIENKRKKIPVITKNVILCIILADIALCSLVIAISYIAFNRQFRTQYDTSMQEICSAVRDCLNPDDFEEYLETRKENENYYDVLKILQSFVDRFDLNVIYVSDVKGPDYTHITYFYDPFIPTEYGKLRIRFCMKKIILSRIIMLLQNGFLKRALRLPVIQLKPAAALI